MKHFLPVCILCIISSISFGQDRSSSEKPNILVIIADDMSLNAGAYGDKVIKTPGIDGLAKDGVLFENAFCTASSCTPSRASILTARYPHQLKEGANLYGPLPVSFPNYTVLLAQKGYKVGLTGKGWGPGNYANGGYKDNPAGPKYESFEAFINQLPRDAPFCFWLGSTDPHRPYSPELKTTTALNEKALKIPSWLPDNPQVREDFLDYYSEVKRFDETVEKAIALLKSIGKYENTLIIVASDNGRPFPRIKANAYDESLRIPLVMRWGHHFRNGTRLPELVSLIDLAPTILEASEIKAPESFTGKSLLPLVTSGKKDPRFEQIFGERERHANIRKGSLSYPIRAIRTKQFLYIQNLRPDRWPAGDPDVFRKPGPFGDIDDGYTKQFLVDNRNNPQYKQLVDWSLEKRPAEELYDLTKDPDALKNLAHDPAYNKIKKQLQTKLDGWRKQTGDPLLNSDTDPFDSYPYVDGQKR